MGELNMNYPWLVTLSLTVLKKSTAYSLFLFFSTL